MMRYWIVVLGEGRLALIMALITETHQRTNIKRKEQVLSHCWSQSFGFYDFVKDELIYSMCIGMFLKV